MTEKKKPSLVDEYKKIRPKYEACTKKFYSLIRTLVEESGLKVHSITPRTKDIESFSKKVSSKIETYKNVSDVTDLSGVRICCYLLSEVEEVAKLIKDNFTVIPELSVDKRETIDPDKFGYLSLHYIVKFSDKRADLPEYKKYKDLLCELQIRTVLQHGWAEIEHDLGYKSAIEIPRHIKRQFSRLAGLLELADEQFDSIKLQLGEYSNEIEKKIVTEPKEVRIDIVSMEKYLLTSPIIKELDEKIVKESNWVLLDNTMADLGVNLCHFYDFKTLEELDDVLKKEKENIIKFRTEFRIRRKSFAHLEVSKGISIFYLGYLLSASKKDVKFAVDYLESIDISSPTDRENFATELIDIRKKINSY